jgi:hypothetical protein
MTAQGADERHLTELHPLRRNRYYYGKVLDVLQLSTEQEYGMANRMVLDRLVLGRGIVAGLGVTVARSGPSRRSPLPAIVLCNVTVDGRSIQIDTSPRPVVPTNVELLELIFCLFKLVRECCGSSDTKPREPSHDFAKGTGPAIDTTPASGRRPAAGRSVRQPAKGPGK